MFGGGSATSNATKGKKNKKSEAASLSTISIAKTKETKTSTRKLPRISYDVLGEPEYEIAEEAVLHDSKISSAMSKKSIRLLKSTSAGAHASHIPSKTSLPAKKAGTLTAGEVNDFTKWEMWKDISSGQLNAFKNQWKIDPKYRYTVQLKNEGFSTPVVDAQVQLINKKTKEVLFETRTDNTGKAELWYDLNNLDPIKVKSDPIKTSDTNSSSALMLTPDNFVGLKNDPLACIGYDPNLKKVPLKSPGLKAMNVSPKVLLPELEARVIINGKTTSIKNLKPFKEGINHKEIEMACGYEDIFDINFVIDATGSMGDEIRYLQAELVDVIKQIQTKREKLKINMGSVFFRDHGDDYVTKKSDFSTNISKSIKFINEQKEAGGGDYPEAVDEALEVALNMNWSNKARSRILFLVLDAPAHHGQKNLDRINKAIRTAAKKGVRIVPVSGSGIQKGAEYLMRTLALTTNGTYVFLTDDSGVGGSHIKPTTDSYDVEKLNDLLVRLAIQYTEVPKCEQEVVKEENADTISITKLQAKEIDYVHFEDILNDVLANNDNNDIDDSNAVASIDSSIIIPDNDPIDDFKPELKVYPNPTTGPATIELKGEVNEMFLRDLTGKIIMRWVKPDASSKINISMYPTGVYFITCPYKRKWLSAKLMVIQ
jgi:hypothetical protein